MNRLKLFALAASVLAALALGLIVFQAATNTVATPALLAQTLGGTPGGGNAAPSETVDDREAVVVDMIHTLATAQVAMRKVRGSYGTFEDMFRMLPSSMGGPPEKRQERPPPSAEQIREQEEYAAAKRAEIGYKVDLGLSDDKSHFWISATPLEYGQTGVRSFYVDEELVVRAADRQGAPATSDDTPLSDLAATIQRAQEVQTARITREFTAYEARHKAFRENVQVDLIGFERTEPTERRYFAQYGTTYRRFSVDLRVTASTAGEYSLEATLNDPYNSGRTMQKTVPLALELGENRVSVAFRSTEAEYPRDKEMFFLDGGRKLTLKTLVYQTTSEREIAGTGSSQKLKWEVTSAAFEFAGTSMIPEP
ncbi:MAG: hypothetical protein IPF82_24085 [Blastocatellia bacterium]|nr:hypothetical protein [Blastocatellia bacterium]